MDRGLISRKPRGSLAKRARRTGIFRSGSSDLNPMAQGGSVLDLIWAVGLGSGGWVASRAAAAVLSPAKLPAAGLSPEKRVRTFPAMDRAWVWPRV